MHLTGSEPDDVLRSGVTDALLEKAILATEPIEIDIKVLFCNVTLTEFILLSIFLLKFSIIFLGIDE